MATGPSGQPSLAAGNRYCPTGSHDRSRPLGRVELRTKQTVPLVFQATRSCGYECDGFMAQWLPPQRRRPDQDQSQVNSVSLAARPSEVCCKRRETLRREAGTFSEPRSRRSGDAVLIAESGRSETTRGQPRQIGSRSYGLGCPSWCRYSGGLQGQSPGEFVANKNDNHPQLTKPSTVVP